MRILHCSRHRYDLGSTTAPDFSLVEAVGYQEAVEAIVSSVSSTEDRFDALLTDLRIAENAKKKVGAPIDYPRFGLQLALLAAVYKIPYIGLSGSSADFLEPMLEQYTDSDGNTINVLEFTIDSSKCILLPTNSSRTVSSGKICSTCQGERICQACKDGKIVGLCGRCYDSGDCSDCDGTGLQQVHESDPWRFSWSQVLRDLVGV